MQEFVIGDHNWQEHCSPVVDGEVKRHGLVPRDYDAYPLGSYAAAPVFDLPLIPRSEWDQRIADMIAQKSRLSDIRLTGMPDGSSIPSRDQNGKGYCWAHSSTSANLVLRALNHDPYADLSAYAIACVIKGFRDEGGWGTESLQFFMDKGCPTSKTWPQQSMSRSNDNPQTWAEAAKYKVTTAWMDVPPGDFDAEATLLLSRLPVVKDENWWSHSIAGLDLVNGASRYGSTRLPSGKLARGADFDLIWGMDNEVTGGYGVRIWNSWGDSWSDRGMGVLSGSKAISDGLVAPRDAQAAA